MAGAQSPADHETEIKPHRGIALFNSLLYPIGCLFDFATDQMKKRVGARMANHLSGTKLLCDGCRFLFFSVALQECGEQANSIGEPPPYRVRPASDIQSLR